MTTTLTIFVVYRSSAVEEPRPCYFDTNEGRTEAKVASLRKEIPGISFGIQKEELVCEACDCGYGVY